MAFRSSAIKLKSNNPRETSALARLFAEELLQTKPEKHALVVGFAGEIGAGKTTFIKAFLRAMGVKKRITSPTFILFRRFALPQLRQSRHSTFLDDRPKRYKLNYKDVWHIDAYRVKSSKEFLQLGLTKIFSYPQNLVLVEWADKIKSVLPKGTIWIEFKHGQKPNERHLTFNRR